MGKNILRNIRLLYTRIKNDDVPALGAQLTYYLVLAFFPFLIFLLTLISYTPSAGKDVMASLSRILPSAAYEVTANILRQTVNLKSPTLLSFSMAIALWASSNGALALMRGLNKAYGREETRPFWKTRGIAVLFILGLSLTIILTFSMLFLGKTLGKYVFNQFGIRYLFVPAWNIIRFSVSLSAMMAVFICMYRFMPDGRLKWKQVLPGSVFSAVGWVLSSLAFSFFADRFVDYSILYGSLGGVFILLAWLYLTSLIFLTGGEINASLAFGPS